MAKTNTAPFPQTPRTKTAVITGATAAADDAPANTVELLTAGLDGAIVTKVSAMPRATATASNLVLFLVKQGTTEKRMVSSALMAAHTVSATAATPRTSFEYTAIDPLRLEAGDKLFAGTMVALAGGIVFTAQFTDY
jgi:hypothetical protein